MIWTILANKITFCHMGDKRLLVMIDDDTDDHQILSMALEELNQPMNYLFFSDCESAVAHFQKESATPPGYVFLDLNLPRINGDQCLEKLLQLKEFDDPCIVIYSTSIPDYWHAKLEKIGVDKFIEKTGSISELITKIQPLFQPG